MTATTHADGLKVRAVRGGLSVLARSVAVRGIAFVGLVVLARLATPSDLGAFVIVSFTVGFLGAIGDVGLAAALIQQDREPTEGELTTAFTVQLLISAAVVVLVALGVVTVGSVAHIDVHDRLLVLALVGALPITVMKTIPAARLERHLRYGPLAAVDVLQMLVFQGSAVVLAVLGMGATGFIIAAVAQAAIGSLAIGMFSPWWLRVGLNGDCLRRLLSFGSMFQAQTVVNYVKDAFTPLFMGAAVGAAAVGYFNWAYTIAAMPLLIAYPLSDVTFAVFARARHDRRLLQSMVERAIRICALTMLPVSVLTIVGADRLVTVVFGSKWHPALPALYVLALSMCTGPLIASSFFSLFYATNRARLALGFTVGWAVVDWALGVPLAMRFGFVGIAWRTLVVAAVSTPVLVFYAKRIVPVRILRQLGGPGLIAASAGLTEWAVYALSPVTLTTTVLGVLAAGAVYVTLVWFVERRMVSAILEGIRRSSPTAEIVRPPEAIIAAGEGF